MIINPSFLEKALDAALSTGADFADIFIEDTYSSNLSLLNQNPHQAIVGQIFGAGIRLFFNHEIIYVTTNDLSQDGLIKAALHAAQARNNPQSKKELIQNLKLKENTFDSIHPFGMHPGSNDKFKKLNWLKTLDQEARHRNSSVTQVEASLNEKFQKIQIANSLGLLTSDERAYTRISLESFVETNGVKESASSRDGQMGTSEMYDSMDLKKMAHDTVDRAVRLTTAKFAPAGEMPVILDNAFGGVIFHEACGHGLETTAVAKKSSVFCDKLGEKIANDCVTAIDDGTIVNGWGSLNIDDEGRPTQKTVLIDKGVLKSYIVDEMGSRQTGYTPTGSGRRQSYKFAPASRMRNTFIAAGNDSLESMIKDIDYGLFAKDMGGGSVNTATGDYNFQAREAYMIRKGRIEEVVKGACLIGRGIETLGRITKVSNDLKLSTGMCGSVSGSIPAAVGQPQLLVSKLIVGGRS